MIDFKNIDRIPRRITKHTVDEGDFYITSMTALEKEQLHENNKEATDEEMLVILIDKVLCDVDGNKISLSLGELKRLPDALFTDIVKATIGSLGEKKS